MGTAMFSAVILGVSVSGVTEGCLRRDVDSSLAEESVIWGSEVTEFLLWL